VVAPSRSRPESATKGPIGPNPEFSVHNNNVHSSVAMTEPQHAHRVVVSEATSSSLEGLDIKVFPTCSRPLGNSSSSSQAVFQTPSVHGGLVPVPRSRPHPLGCGIPATNTLRPLARRPAGSAPSDMGQVKEASKTSAVHAPRKHRRAVSDDQPTPLQKSSESAILTDVDQTDIKRAHVTKWESEENVAAVVAEINQCYQDHVDAFQSCYAYCMLSDTEYSDFDEFDDDEEWEEYQQDYEDYGRVSSSGRLRCH